MTVDFCCRSGDVCLPEPRFPVETGSVIFAPNSSIFIVFFKSLTSLKICVIDVLVCETNRYAEQHLTAFNLLFSNKNVDIKFSVHDTFPE
jgi:hypothetical protein